MIATFDIPEAEEQAFFAEVKRYMALTGKDAEYVVNRTSLNVAIKANQNTPEANVGDIRALKDRPWWPKLVAKRLSKSGYRLREGVGARMPKRYKGRVTISAGKYTREEARAVSKRLIDIRVRRRGYIRSGWSPAIVALSKQKAASRGRNSMARVPRWAKGSKAPGDVIVAKPGVHPVAEIINKAAGVLEVATPALRKAIVLATIDMRQFLNEKYGETAREFSR